MKSSDLHQTFFQKVHCTVHCWVQCTIAKGTLYLALLLLLSTFASAGQNIVVSAGGKLTVYKQEGDSLSQTQQFEMNDSSGPMGISPDGKHLYVNTGIPNENGTKTKRGKPVLTPAFATFSIAKDGALTHVHTAPSDWNCGYLRPDVTGKFFAGNHYGNGWVGVWKVAEDGVYRGAVPRTFELEKRAHSAVFSGDNRFLFVPATGPNKVFQLVFNQKTGAIHPNQPSSAPGPKLDTEARQPRHIVFHPTIDFAYTTCEKDLPGAGAWKYDKERGLLENIQGIRSVDGNEGVSTADLHLSKDGRFLYVSNRDRNGDRNSITLFSINQENGLLTFEKRFPCERIPRSFCLGTEGKYLFVAGQGEARLGVYRINQENGHLEKTSAIDTAGFARWVTAIATE